MMSSWCGTRGTRPIRSPGLASRTLGLCPARSTERSSSRWFIVSHRREGEPMLTYTLIALTLVGTPKSPAPACTLAGSAVRARWSAAIPPASTADAPLHLVADVPLPGSASRFDYQSLESGPGRLFISHMGAGQLVVFDVRAGRVIGNLDGFPTVTGVLAVPPEHRAYASATGEHAVRCGLTLCDRRGPNRQPAGGDRPGDAHDRASDHTRQSGSPSARGLH